MKQKVLTIAVPTYNLGELILKNLTSFEQVEERYYDDFEVLIINDGSKDNTPEIVAEFISNTKMHNIKFIDKENGGHGSTINKGIELAQGKYFKLIDGDDWVNPIEFMKFLDVLKQLNSNLIITNYTEQHVYENREEFVKITNFNDDQYEIPLENFRFPMHSITYKTSILKDNKIKISEKIFYVDIEYTLYPMLYIEHYTYLNLNVYQYLLGREQQSMNKQQMIKNAQHHLIVTINILNFYTKYKDKMSDVLETVVVDTLDYLVNKQLILSSYAQDRKVALRKLVTTLQNSAYTYKLNPEKKTVYLIYYNAKTNFIFDFILSYYINYKLKKIFI